MVAEKATSTTSLTPSGIEVEYTFPPNRGYRVRRPSPIEEMKAEPILGLTQRWRDVPSVTEVLEVLDKPALISWGERIGVQGPLKLVQLGLLREVHANGQPVLGYRDGDFWRVADDDQVLELLKHQQLRTYQQKETAGERGQAVHDALEVWATKGTLPDPSIYPPEEQAYVVGLVNFLKAVEPEPVDSEVMVGSAEHGFAGRYDVRWRIPKECDVVYHVTPKRGPKLARLMPGLLLGDLKTSKDVYPSHSRQLEAYEQASIECGYEPTDARGILNVGGWIKNPDTGKWEQRPPYYKFVRSWGVFEDFRVVLDVWRSEQAMKERKKR